MLCEFGGKDIGDSVPDSEHCAEQLADFERSYDAEASKLRAAFVAEVAQLYNGAEE